MSQADKPATAQTASQESGASEFKRIAGEVGREARRSPMPVFIAALAAFLALVSMANGAADKRAMQSHIEAANQFAFYQAKNIRKTDSVIAAGLFEALGKATLGQEWAAKAGRYDAEKADILKAARAEQAKRELAIKQGGYFGIAITMLQIAIVLASASLILQGGFLLAGAVVLTLVAIFFTANGYGLFVEVPADPVQIYQWIKSGALAAKAG